MMHKKFFVHLQQKFQEKYIQDTHHSNMMTNAPYGFTGLWDI